MNIRSLTVGAALPDDSRSRAELISRLGSFAHAGGTALEAAGFTVQTTRLATQPLEDWLQASPGSEAVTEIADVGQACVDAGLDYFSTGTVQAAHAGEEMSPLLALLPDILLATPNAFASVQVASRIAPVGVNMVAVEAAARIIRALADTTPDGFGNLRFAAAANCPPHVPFFPAAYYVEDETNGGRPEFGLALEAADLAVRAVAGAGSLEEARSALLGLLEEEAGRAAEACVALSIEHGYTFTGLDISMAPYPEQARSIGHALEVVIGGPLGGPGTLAAAAFFTGVLKQARAQLPTVGYSGLMLPVLEDSTLAARAAEGLATLDTLLLMSAVCGLGLDTVPLPGSITQRQLELIILDVAALALKLDKPLTARLFPVPGKAAGDPAEWPDFPYFARGKVMAVLGNSTGGGLLTGDFISVL